MRIKSVLAVLLLLASPAYAQKSKTALQAEINSSFPNNATGAITPAVVRGVFSDFVNSWQQYVAVNNQAGTSYTLQASDYGAVINFTHSGAIAVTIPASTGSFLTFNSYIYNSGTGTITVTPTAATINGLATLTINGGTTYWIFSDGTGLNYIAFLMNIPLVTVFASPPPIGGTAPNSIAATTLSATGLTTLQGATDVIIPGEPTPSHLLVVNGSAVAPITAANVPAMLISRQEAIVGAGGPQSSALYVESNGNNSGGNNGNIAIAIGSTGVGSSDNIGFNVVSANNASSTVHGAFGAYLDVRALGTKASALSIESGLLNSTGSDLPYVATPFAASTQVAIQLDLAYSGGAGLNLGTAGIIMRSTNSSYLDVGIGFWPTSIKTASIKDESTAITSYVLSGTHTTGVDASGATISGNFLKGPGSTFLVAGTGDTAILKAAPTLSLSDTGTGTASISFKQSTSTLAYQFGNQGGQWFEYDAVNARYFLRMNVTANLLELASTGATAIDVNIGATGSITKILGTTASTSTSTGSLQNAGGFANAGAGWFGGLINTVSTVQSAGVIQTAAAPTVAAAQIGYGSTTAAAANCNVTSPTPTGCVVINVAGTTRYIPYY